MNYVLSFFTYENRGRAYIYMADVAGIERRVSTGLWFTEIDLWISVYRYIESWTISCSVCSFATCIPRLFKSIKEWEWMFEKRTQEPLLRMEIQWDGMGMPSDEKLRGQWDRYTGLETLTGCCFFSLFLSFIVRPSLFLNTYFMYLRTDIWIHNVSSSPGVDSMTDTLGR